MAAMLVLMEALKCTKIGDLQWHVYTAIYENRLIRVCTLVSENRHTDGKAHAAHSEDTILLLRNNKRGKKKRCDFQTAEHRCKY
jgi:hypothetical protein